MKTYYCDCKKYCQGDQKVVSRATYFNHKKHRERYTPRFREFLNRHPVIAPKPGPSVTNTQPVPQYSRTAQVEGIVDCDAIDVSIISLVFPILLITIC